MTQDTKSVATDTLINPITEWLKTQIDLLPVNTEYSVWIVLAGILVLGSLVYIATRFLIIHPILKSSLLNKSHLVAPLISNRISSSLATLLALAISIGVVQFVPHLEFVREFLNRILVSLAILAFARLILRLGRYADDVYSSRASVARDGALKGYVTVGGFLVYAISLILVISTLVGESPVYFLTGLSAASAILLILFRDTLLSIFANIIVTTGDLAREGDWIRVQGTDADGYVIDVSLNVIKVQNFDKTISVLPTYMLVQSSFINYRGMYKSGGRRIKRSVILDLRTIRELTNDEINSIGKMHLGARALELEEQGIKNSPEHYAQSGISNSGLFRSYIRAYLESHPEIHSKGFTTLVRHLQPTEFGLPIQLYCFTNTTDWAAYEGIQASIFDHLFSVLSQFGLRAYQSESDFTEPGPDSRMPTVVIAPQTDESKPASP